MVALAGRSGSGKSTVADLLVRHLDPDRGRVLLDGVDLRAVALAELRARVAVVEQDTFVFHASILENVRYARPDADRNAVSEAVERAGLGDFVASLPDGLDTVGGRGGTGRFRRASGSAWRSARALLADPAVLVLDEATSALDAEAQAKVVAAYAEVTRGRTTVVISHREEVVGSADRVVVLEGGEGRMTPEDPIERESGRLPPGRICIQSLPLRDLRGRGVAVAVIDSGVNPEHPHVGSVAGGVRIDLSGGVSDDWVGPAGARGRRSSRPSRRRRPRRSCTRCASSTTA